jgi:hypothetical protein
LGEGEAEDLFEDQRGNGKEFLSGKGLALYGASKMESFGMNLRGRELLLVFG